MSSSSRSLDLASLQPLSPRQLRLVASSAGRARARVSIVGRPQARGQLVAGAAVAQKSHAIDLEIADTFTGGSGPNHPWFPLFGALSSLTDRAPASLLGAKEKAADEPSSLDRHRYVRDGLLHSLGFS
jgi:hypothetical protein